MSLELEQLKGELEDFVRSVKPDTIKQAKVLSINEDDATVEVEMGDESIIPDVRLRSIIKAGNRKLIIPSVNSYILIGRIETGSEFVVVAVESIDKEVIIIGNSKFEITEDGCEVSKGADSLKDAINLIIGSIEPIVILYGNNPDFEKLEIAKNKIANIFK